MRRLPPSPPAIHGLAELVIDASDDSRRVRIVSWHLNALHARHQGPPLPAINAAAGRRLLQMDLEPVAGGVRFDVRLAREVVEGQQTAFWDLELHHAAQVSRAFGTTCRTRTAPTLEFDPAMPPAWLTERV